MTTVASSARTRELRQISLSLSLSLSVSLSLSLSLSLGLSWTSQKLFSPLYDPPCSCSVGEEEEEEEESYFSLLPRSAIAASVI